MQLLIISKTRRPRSSENRTVSFSSISSPPLKLKRSRCRATFLTPPFHRRLKLEFKLSFTQTFVKKSNTLVRVTRRACTCSFIIQLQRKVLLDTGGQLRLILQSSPRWRGVTCYFDRPTKKPIATVHCSPRFLVVFFVEFSPSQKIQTIPPIGCNNQQTTLLHCRIAIPMCILSVMQCIVSTTRIYLISNW